MKIAIWCGMGWVYEAPKVSTYKRKTARQLTSEETMAMT